MNLNSWELFFEGEIQGKLTHGQAREKLENSQNGRQLKIRLMVLLKKIKKIKDGFGHCAGCRGISNEFHCLLYIFD